MSRSSPRLGRRGSPASETASTGQGFGLACAKRKKSWASAFGRMTRWAWTLPGASPGVLPVKSPARIRSRSRVPAATPRSSASFITPHPHAQFGLFYHTYTRRCTLERPLFRRRDCPGNLRDDIVKALAGFTRIGPAGVVVGYAASFALLSLALRGIDLSIAYAVWSGVGTAIVALIGILWFGEPTGAWKLLSLALIVLGVAGLHLSGRAS